MSSQGQTHQQPSRSRELPFGDQIVAGLPWRWAVQGRIFILAGLGFMFDAWDVTLNGFLTPLIGTAFEIAPEDRGWVTAANLAGMAIGAVTWGSIADRLGRKRAFSITILIFALFSVAAAFAPAYGWFLAARFIAGLGLGGAIPIDYAIVGEYSPRAVRGRVLSALDGWWPLGATLAGLSALVFVAVPEGWRWMLSLMILPALLTYWIRRHIPESPVFLARAGREGEARRVIDDLVARTGAPVTEYRIDTLEAVRESPLRVLTSTFVQVWRYNPVVTAVAWFLFVSILLVYYSALAWMPSILTSAGFTANTAFLGTTFMAATGIIGVVAAILLVDRIGRKWALGTSAPLAAASLYVFSLVTDQPALALTLLGVFGFVIQITIPVLYAYISELYPTRLRAIGFGWASSVSRVATAISPVLFAQILWPQFGLPATLAVLGVSVVAAVLLMAFLAPETSHRDLEGVEDGGRG